MERYKVSNRSIHRSTWNRSALVHIIGIRWYCSLLRASNLQNSDFRDVNWHFQAKWEQIKLAIILKRQIKSQRNLVTKYGSLLREQSRISVYVLWQVGNVATINITITRYLRNRWSHYIKFDGNHHHGGNAYNDVCRSSRPEVHIWRIFSLQN